MGAAPTTTGRVGTARRRGARQARRRGVRRRNQWWNPLKWNAGSNLVDLGRSAVRARHRWWRATSCRSRVGWLGGHGEGLRRSRGEAAGEELGADPVERSCSERGNHRRVSLPAGRLGRQREGAPSADGSAMGRSPRSSPRSGKPAWRRRAAGSQPLRWNVRRPPVNTDDLWPDLYEAESRVLSIQEKLHRRATGDSRRRFDDLCNLVADHAFLVMAWHRVRGNQGARSAGSTDWHPARSGSGSAGSWTSYETISRRRFRPLPVRERMIPKANGKLRALGIPPPGTGPSRPPSSWCSSRSSRRISSRVHTASARGVEPRTQSPRSITSPPNPGTTPGCWRPTSKRASTRSTTPPSWDGCVAGSGIAAWWI